MPKTNKLLVNISLLIIILIICLFVLEISLKFILPQGNPLWGYDDMIGIKFAPDRCTRYISPEFNVELCANSEGFHDTEHDLEKDATVTRVAVLGDSLTAAREVEIEKRFTNLVEQELGNTCKKDFEFLNFAVAGQGTGLQLLTFRHYAEKYNPDYTILFLYPENDIADNYLPLLDRDYVPSFVLTENNELEEVPFNDAPIISNPVLYTVSQKVFPNLFSLVGNFFKHIQAEDYQIDAVYTYLYVYSPDESEAYKEAWKIEEKLLKELKEEVEASGSEFIVFIVASYDQAVNIKDHRDIDIVKDFDAALPNKRLKVMLQELEIEYYDLLREYDFKNEDYSEFHFKQDHHLTEEGHEFVADLILDKLIKTELCEFKCDQEEQSCI